MLDYFRLQYRMTNRHLTEFGLPPIVAYILSLALFIGLSLFLFYKTEYAEWIYLFIALISVSKLSETRRSDFLKTCFPKNSFFLIRLIENGIVLLPFIVFLIYHHSFIPTLLIVIIGIALALLKFKNTFNHSIPTPFYKRPFEFIVGFRNTFFLFAFAYILTIVAISVGNFNLGIFSLLLVFLLSSSYYSSPENEYYVWSYNLTSTQFILEKIKTAILFSSFLSIPIIVLLGVFHLDQIDILLIFLLLGYTFLITIILAKYSAYPNKINLPEAILIGVCAYFPPLLIGVIPFFYIKSIKHLNELLE